MKTKVVVIFGSKGNEHQISLLSGNNIMNAIPRDKYEVLPVGITKTGDWYAFEKSPIKNPQDAKLVELDISAGQKIHFEDLLNLADVVFPILHGKYGEGGYIQGLLELLDLPFVGTDTLASSIAMDKDMTKKILQNDGINVAKWYSLYSHEKLEADLIFDDLDFPIFIKPANEGSSVGVYKAKNEKEVWDYLEKAFTFDKKVLLEEAIAGREIECAVLGNIDNLQASTPGEIVVTGDHEFYDYDAKYLDENGSKVIVPADLNHKEILLIKKTAIKVCLALGIEGLARVDGFLTADGDFIINEVNTMPGFTNISMYPKMWENDGLSQAELTDKLIQLGIARHKRDNV